MSIILASAYAPVLPLSWLAIPRLVSPRLASDIVYSLPVTHTFTEELDRDENATRDSISKWYHRH